MSVTASSKQYPWAAWVGLAFAMYAASFYASELGMSQTGVVALWPAAGISLWGCWRYGWPGAIFAYIGFHGYGLLHIDADWDNFLPSVGNAGAAMIGALLIKRFGPKAGKSALRHMLHIIFIGGTSLACISGAIGATHLALNLGLDSYSSFVLTLRWILSDMAGVVITAPFLFSWSLAQDIRRRRTGQSNDVRLRQWFGVETVVAILTSLVLCALTFTTLPELSSSAVFALVSTPIVAWIVMRPSRIKALGALSILGTTSLTLSAQSLNSDNSELLETQLFTLMFLTAAFLLHELLKEMRNKNAALENHTQKLESAVAERTQEYLAAKQKAESADRAKTEFLANTSHEVRTPLNAILGMAEFLAESPLPKQQANQVQTILTAGRSLMALLNDVIDLSKVEAGRLEIEPHPTNPKALLENLRSLWRTNADAKRLTLQTSSSSSDDYYLMDEHRLRQCLSNLLSNAIKFTNQGTVKISHTCEQDQHTFKVSDTGLGMDKASLDKLFQPFEQLDNSITREFGGAGLGLAITKRLTELMGGTITVSSTPNKGTEFTIQLPAQACEAPDQEADPSEDTRTLNGLKILLVEDNPVNRIVAKGHLKQLNVDFDEVENGKQCLDKLAEKAYDLVLLDIHMPVMDGFETIRHIRASNESWQHVPVIALTADAMRDDRNRLLTEGMNGYASKPIDRSLLIKEMSQVLRNARAHDVSL